MKILAVGLKWPPETFLQRLFAGLTESGIEITVVSKQRPEIKTGLKWLHPALLRFQNIKKWDILYFPWNSAAIENFHLLDRGVPSVISCRGAQVNVAPHSPDRKMAEGLKKTFEKASKVHCVSEAIQKEAQLYGLDAHKSVVIRPAVDTAFFYPAETKKTNQFRVISTGSLIWRKGYEYALMAVRRLVDEGIPVLYTIIGEGLERQRILYTIHDLKIAENVRLAGGLSPDQVRSELQNSDVFLLSSLSEGISNAVLEAMACGLPIVTTDCGGMREAVADGREGFVVPVRDAQKTFEALVKIFKDSQKSRAMGEAARLRVKNKFDLKNQIYAFDSLFHTVKA